MQSLPELVSGIETATLVEVFENGVVCESPCVYNLRARKCSQIKAAENCEDVGHADVIRQYIVLANGEEIHHDFEIDISDMQF
jgi:hypothetical protein